MKKGDRVKIIADGEYKGFWGEILEISPYYHVKIYNGVTQRFSSHHLELIEPSLDCLMVGDVLVDKDGDEGEVLGVTEKLFARDYHIIKGQEINWYESKTAKYSGFKLKGTEETEYAYDKDQNRIGEIVDGKIIKT